MPGLVNVRVYRAGHGSTVPGAAVFLLETAAEFPIGSRGCVVLVPGVTKPAKMGLSEPESLRA
jgi:hypothetical protein